MYDLTRRACVYRTWDSAVRASPFSRVYPSKEVYKGAQVLGTSYEDCGVLSYLSRHVQVTHSHRSPRRLGKRQQWRDHECSPTSQKAVISGKRLRPKVAPPSNAY